MEEMTQKLQRAATVKKTLYDISYELLGYKCFSLCCYESENIASMVNFYHVMAICILQLSWTTASCKHLRLDFNNFFYMNFNKSSKMASKSGPANWRMSGWIL